jgi:hypothetical protein
MLSDALLLPLVHWGISFVVAFVVMAAMGSQ